MTNEEKKSLIAAVTSSDAFHSHNRILHRELLEHLATHSSRQDRHLRTEEYLKKFFHPGYSGKVSMFLLRLAQTLSDYFDTEEGQRHTHRIEIVRGRKDVHPDDRNSIRFPLNRKALARRFWNAYLDDHIPTFIVYGVPLFIKSADQKIFTRHADVNVPAAARRKKLRGKVSFPFVAHGDLLAAVELHRWMVEQGMLVNFAPFKANDNLDSLLKATSKDANIIAVGSTRVSGILAEYQRLPLRKKENEQKYLPFRLRLYDAVRLNDRQKKIGAAIEEEESGSVLSVPVIITRRAGVIRGSVTLVASNHGRAVARACQILTNDDDLSELFQDERLQKWIGELPVHFQILLRVDVFAGETMGGKFTVEDVWPSD